MPLVFSSCVNLVDMQQECIETGPNDIFIGMERGSQHIKQFRRKKSLSHLTQHFASSALPLEKLKT